MNIISALFWRDRSMHEITFGKKIGILFYLILIVSANIINCGETILNKPLPSLHICIEKQTILLLLRHFHKTIIISNF